MSALTDYSKWDAIDDSSDAASDAEEPSAEPKEDPVLTGARNVVRELRAKLSLLPDGTLDEGWTSPPVHTSNKSTCRDATPRGSITTSAVGLTV